jgi:hypothetical protein
MHYTVGKDQFRRSPLPATFSHSTPPLPLIPTLETRIRIHHVTGTFRRILLSTTLLTRNLLCQMSLLPPQILHLLRWNLPPSAARQDQFEMPVGRTSNKHKVMNTYKRQQNCVPCSFNLMQKMTYSDCFIMSIHRSNFCYYEDMASHAYSSVQLSKPIGYYIIVTLRLSGPLRFAIKYL